MQSADLQRPIVASTRCGSFRHTTALAARCHHLVPPQRADGRVGQHCVARCVCAGGQHRGAACGELEGRCVAQQRRCAGCGSRWECSRNDTKILAWLEDIIHLHKVAVVGFSCVSSVHLLSTSACRATGTGSSSSPPPWGGRTATVGRDRSGNAEPVVQAITCCSAWVCAAGLPVSMLPVRAIMGVYSSHLILPSLPDFPFPAAPLPQSTISTKCRCCRPLTASSR